MRPLTEAEAYHRCHGTRESDVKVVRLPPRRKRYTLKVSGEALRTAFEERLSRREPEEETSEVAGLS